MGGGGGGVKVKFSAGAVMGIGSRAGLLTSGVRSTVVLFADALGVGNAAKITSIIPEITVASAKCFFG